MGHRYRAPGTRVSWVRNENDTPRFALSRSAASLRFRLARAVGKITDLIITFQELKAFRIYHAKTTGVRLVHAFF